MVFRVLTPCRLVDGYCRFRCEFCPHFQACHVPVVASKTLIPARVTVTNCGGQSVTLTGFVPNASVFPCQHHSTDAPYTFSHLSPTSCYIYNWQRRVTACLQNLLRASFDSEWVKGKGKAVPLQACSGPEGSKKLRFPDFMTTAQDGGKVVSLTHRPPLPPGNTPGTYYC